MKTYAYSLITFGSRQIVIGRQGENLATRIDVDVTPWKTEYPSGTVSLFVVPPVGNGYLAAIEEDGSTIRWTIRDTDTAYDGHGKAELILMDASGTVIKSVTAYTICAKSPSAAEPADPPEAIRPWVEKILEAIKSGDVSAEAIAAAVEAYIQEHGVQVEETDPTVPDWAKQPSKPTYTASEVGARPDTWTPSASEVGARPDTWMPSAADVGADAAGTASGAVAAHNVSGAAHADLRALIDGLNSRLNALADSDDTTLDQLSEIVAYIKSNKTLIDAVTTGKVSVSDIVDNLTTNASGKVLSAAQGVALKAMIDGIVIPTALPNPQPITINGQRYDGSEAVTVTVSSEGGGTPVEIDSTLTQSGKAADAKAVGDRLSALNEANATQDERITTLEQTIPSGSSGLTVAQVNALNDMFKVAAYIKSDVSAEYSAFKTAFGIEDSGEEPVEPEKTLTSISATYSGGDVAVGTSLDDLTGIVVTATYSDGSTATVTGYTLSGSIAEGANTIMVSYGSKTATFTVTGIVEVVDEKWSYTLSDLTVMKGSIGNNIAGEITANIGTAQAIRRRHYAIETEGVKQIIYTEVAANLESDINNYTRKGLYPIPIPKTAIKVTYSIEPATQYPAICIYEYDANTDTYTRTADPGWKLGGGTYTLTPKDNQYLTIASKYDATGNQYPTEPTAVSIVFE